MKKLIYYLNLFLILMFYSVSGLTTTIFISAEDINKIADD